jgi:hypothetical protein
MADCRVFVDVMIFDVVFHRSMEVLNSTLLVIPGVVPDLGRGRHEPFDFKQALRSTIDTTTHCVHVEHDLIFRQRTDLATQGKVWVVIVRKRCEHQVHGF